MYFPIYATTLKEVTECLHVFIALKNPLEKEKMFSIFKPKMREHLQRKWKLDNDNPSFFYSLLDGENKELVANHFKISSDKLFRVDNFFKTVSCSYFPCEEEEKNIFGKQINIPWKRDQSVDFFLSLSSNKEKEDLIKWANKQNSSLDYIYL